ncbi:MAG TPA: YegS/Rv2252/BmrU family lipid kinase [Chitinophagaceae bacterium]|nr:YegS/Rv2252/BmrU family lipid kinase [Chitinophagaceae bacterium]
MPHSFPKLLFIINLRSGNHKTDWKKQIVDHFAEEKHSIELFELTEHIDMEAIKAKIRETGPDKVIAVGGDGTVKMVAECLLNSEIPLGILPAGSANGMARELSIPEAPAEALDIILRGEIQTIHLIRINDELCIHLSDVGFNALVIKTFAEGNIRGMWGYVKASWKALLSHKKMVVELNVGGETISRQAVMVVVANASTYGNGVKINPVGSLYDDLFEVVIIKEISFLEIFKARFRRRRFNPKKIEILQTHLVNISSKSRIHFQVDGEYRGKVKNIKAEIIPRAIQVIVGRDGR